MQVKYMPFELKLRHPFSIAKFTRTSTPLLLLKLTLDGIDGYGEASMVPYMGETYQGAEEFLSKVNWGKICFPFNFEEIIADLDDIADGQPAIKAAIDIALNDINGKILNKPCYQIYGADLEKMPVTSYTIGIDTPEVLREKLKDAEICKVVKVKLGKENDREIIETIRSVTDAPLYVDANQGWEDKQQAIDLIYWLHDKGVELIEQPMDKGNIEGNAWLTERSPIPLLADEAVQRFKDIDSLIGVYHGINVKLMKSCGMYEGNKMIIRAKQLGMKVLIGCMSETSCATLAAAALAPLCNWADLDGPFLTTNNPFKNPKFEAGKWSLSNAPGLGLEGIEPNLFF